MLETLTKGFRAARQRLSGMGADVVHLTASFRAVPSLQQAVNAAFAPRMGEQSYVPLAPIRAEDASDSGASTRSSFSKRLIRLCTWLALVFL